MNSVFSAFKNNKIDTSNNQLHKSKKIISPENGSSYANLRHMREIGSSAKMSTFVDDSDENGTQLRLTKCTMSNQPASPTISSFQLTEDTEPFPSSVIKSEAINTCEYNSNVEMNDTDVVDHISLCTETNHEFIDKNAISVNESTKFNELDDARIASSISMNSYVNHLPPRQSIPSTVNVISNHGHTERHSSKKLSIENKENNEITLPSPSNSSDIRVDGSDTISSVSDSIVSNCNSVQVNGNDMTHTPILSAAINKKSNKCTESMTLPNKNSSSNRFHKRLSLSGIGNNPLPSVHGRPTSANANNTGETKRTRISTHQRNLSLDFR